jgi:hypothetical protein
MNAVCAFRCIDPRLITSDAASADKTAAFPNVGTPLYSHERQPDYHRQTAI